MNILVVCEGNICRSPIAEAILRDRAGSAHIVRSAGISAPVGRPAHPYSIEVCASHGLDITRHRATQMDANLLRASDLVMVMETDHVRRIQSAFPWTSGRIWRLGHHLDQDYADLLDQAQEAFHLFFQSVLQALDGWAPLLRT